MGKVNTSIVHSVVPAASGGNALAAAFAAMSSGQTSELVLTDTHWPTDGSRINSQAQTANGKWDHVNSKLYLYNKRSGAATGALHVYDAATGLWSQPWTGYPSSADSTTNLNGNCYNTWGISPVDQKFFIADYYNNLRKWDAQSTQAFTLVGPLVNSNFASIATQGDKPYSVEFLKDGYGSGQEGILIATPKRLYLSKRDVSIAATVLWSADASQSLGYLSLHRSPRTTIASLFLVGGTGYTKITGAYTSSEARATLEVPVYFIASDGVVTRMPDAPSANIGPASATYDRVCNYDNVLYLFEGDGGNGIWKLEADINGGGFYAWTKLPYTHNFKTVSTSVPFSVTPIPQYGGIVGISSSSASSSAYSSRIRMFLYKV